MFSRQPPVPVHAPGVRVVLNALEPARSQELHDTGQRAVPCGPDHVFRRQRRRHSERRLDNDGTERGVLGWPVFRLRGRSLRTKVEGRPDVRHQRLLFWWLAAVLDGVRDHRTVEADRAHQHGGPDNNYRGSADGNQAISIQYATCGPFFTVD